MTTYRPAAFAYLTGQLSAYSNPPAISNLTGGGKFDFQGNVLPWAGNTIICHIDRDSAEYNSLVSVQSALQAGPHSDAFTYLPPSSFHMTVFQGVSAAYASGKEWPTDVPTTSERNTVSRILLDRLEDVSFSNSYRIRPVDIFAGHSVTVEGADAEQGSLLCRTREQLRTATGINPTNFNTYAFHITLAYLVRWLTDDEARAVIELSNEQAEWVRGVAPQITLSALEFCNFENMHHFEPLACLNSEEPDQAN